MKKAARLGADVKYQIAAALIFSIAVILVQPNVEAGMNDDWSFIRTAHDLAATGRLQYNGWSAPLIGIQAYWGALFIKLFGFSFLTARASIWSLDVLSIPLLWNLLRRAELNQRQAFFALLTLLLSPLSLPNLLAFMTDMPAFFLFAAALWAALKAWDAEQDKHASFWTCVTALCGFLSGSIRQVYWLSGICFLVILAFTRMRLVRGRILIAALITVTLIIAITASHWLAQQAYVPAETTLADIRETSWQEMATDSATYMARYCVGAALMLLPVSLLFLRSAFLQIRLWVHLLIWIGALAAIHYLAQPLPWLGNTISQEGVLLHHTVSVGDKPVLLSAPVILILGSLALACAIYSIIQLSSDLRFRLDTGIGRFAALTVPFLGCYLAVLAFRATSFGLYDRYLIPTVFIVSAIAVAAYAKTNQTLSPLSVVCAGAFVLYAVATSHDYFAEARAKLQATQQVLRTGKPRTAIMSGFEYDSWSEVDLAGHVNNELVHRPPDAYRDEDDCNGPEEVQMWWRTLTPDIHASYIISLTHLSKLPAAGFAPVIYWRWLPLARSYVFTAKADPPLACGPSRDN